MMERKYIRHIVLYSFALVACFGLFLAAILVPEINWAWWSVAMVVFGAVGAFSLYELDQVQMFIRQADRCFEKLRVRNENQAEVIRNLMANGSASRGTKVRALETCPDCGTDILPDEKCDCEDKNGEEIEAGRVVIHNERCDCDRCTRPVLPSEKFEDDDWRYSEAHWRNRRWTLDDTKSMSPSDEEVEMSPGVFVLHEIDHTGD